MRILRIEDQTVTFSEKPEIRTTATVNGGKKAEPAGEVTIKDTVSYTGLTPGKTYKLSGVLMDKSSGGKLLVKVKGEGLELRAMTAGELRIGGKIASVEWVGPC